MYLPMPHIVPWGRPYILIEIFHFIHLRIQVSVGWDQPFVYIMPIFMIIYVVEIAAISVNRFSIIRLPMHGVVHKFPDKSALISGIFSHQLHIFLEATK